ncbi:MAG: glycine betaine transporter [Flavobacteriales bacterium]
MLLLFAIYVYIDTVGFYTHIEDGALWVREWFGTFYLWLGLGCFCFILAISLSPFGKRKLGPKDALPEFSRGAWIAMLYSAGMGAGILLRAVQEPVFMLQNPPIQTGSAIEIIALEYTFYQWGFTAWAFYGLFALILGYYLYNSKTPALISATLGDFSKPSRAKRFWKDSIDVLTIVTTVFGLIGAIALGTTQINGGLNHIFDSEFGIETTIGLVVLISVLAFISVWSGMHKGIKMISSWNIWITLAILVFIFAQSDVMSVLGNFGKSLYHYVLDFIPLSIAKAPFDPGKEFLTDWTYYYWAFWLAWAPFTGVFIARISKGRTIRELLIGVLLIPSIGTFFWFSVFGTSAFQLIESWGTYSNEFGNVFSSIFVFFENYPMAGVLNMITLVLLVSFLITSVDSAVFVLSMFTDQGTGNPSKKHRLIWSVCLAVFSVAILLLGNARADIDVLIALQKLLIITSLPFALFIVLMVLLFVKHLINNRHVNSR